MSEHLQALCHAARMYTPDPPMDWRTAASIWTGLAAVAWAAATPFIIRAVRTHRP